MTDDVRKRTITLKMTLEDDVYFLVRGSTGEPVARLAPAGINGLRLAPEWWDKTEPEPDPWRSVCGPFSSGDEPWGSCAIKGVKPQSLEEQWERCVRNAMSKLRIQDAEDPMK